MKRLFCFLAVLLSTHYLLAQTSSQFDDGAQNNERRDYSHIETCSKGIDEDGEGDVVPMLFNVTVRQYCDFLNAVAADDPHHLYDERMGLNNEDACIVRAGLPGNYSYSVIEGRGDYTITNISWFDQARFCNWLENGQPTGPQGPETTEEGSYTLSGATDKIVCRNEGFTYFLPDQEMREVQANLFNHSTLLSLNQLQSDSDPCLKSSAGFCIVTSVTSKLMMNPSFEGEGKAIETLEKILKRDKSILANGSIERELVSDDIIRTGVEKNDIAKFTNEKPRLLGGGPKPNLTKEAKSSEEKSEQDDASLSTEKALAIEKQFRDAITAYPDAPRLIVTEREIVPPDPNVVSSNNDRENQKIMRMLKDLITTRYSSAIANDITELNPMAFARAEPLSAAKISGILQRCKTVHFNEGAVISNAVEENVGQNSEVPYPFKLDHFRNAVIESPNASHLVIGKEAGQSIILSSSFTSDSANKNKKENQDVSKALRAALEGELPLEVVCDLLPQDHIDAGTPLTSARVREILEEAKTGATTGSEESMAKCVLHGLDTTSKICSDNNISVAIFGTDIPASAVPKRTIPTSSSANTITKNIVDFLRSGPRFAWNKLSEDTLLETLFSEFPSKFQEEVDLKNQKPPSFRYIAKESDSEEKKEDQNRLDERKKADDFQAKATELLDQMRKQISDDDSYQTIKQEVEKMAEMAKKAEKEWEKLAEIKLKKQKQIIITKKELRFLDRGSLREEESKKRELERKRDSLDHWLISLKRWEVRAKADELETYDQELKNKFDDITENISIIDKRRIAEREWEELATLHPLTQLKTLADNGDIEALEKWTNMMMISNKMDNAKNRLIYLRNCAETDQKDAFRFRKNAKQADSSELWNEANKAEEKAYASTQKLNLEEENLNKTIEESALVGGANSKRMADNVSDFKSYLKEADGRVIRRLNCYLKLTKDQEWRDSKNIFSKLQEEAISKWVNNKSNFISNLLQPFFHAQAEALSKEDEELSNQASDEAKELLKSAIKVYSNEIVQTSMSALSERKLNILSILETIVEDSQQAKKEKKIDYDRSSTAADVAQKAAPKVNSVANFVEKKIVEEATSPKVLEAIDRNLSNTSSDIVGATGSIVGEILGGPAGSFVGAQLGKAVIPVVNKIYKTAVDTGLVTVQKINPLENINALEVKRRRELEEQTIIADVEEQIYHTILAEEERLSHIEKNFIEMLKFRIELAAYRYQMLDDAVEWNLLGESQKEAYNRAIKGLKQSESQDILKMSESTSSFFESELQTPFTGINLSEMDERSSLAQTSENGDKDYYFQGKDTPLTIDENIISWNSNVDITGALTAEKKAVAARSIAWDEMKIAPEVEQTINDWENVITRLKDRLSGVDQSDLITTILLNSEIAWVEAKRATWKALSLRDKANANKGKEEHKLVWQRAEEAEKEAGVCWGKAVQKKQSALRLIDDTTQEADQYRALLKLEVVWAEAEKERAELRAFELGASNADLPKYGENMDIYQGKWRKAKDISVQVGQKWQNILDLYNQTSSHLAEDKRKMWEEHLINNAIYKKMFYSLDLLWLEASEAQQIAKIFKNRTQLQVNTQSYTVVGSIWDEAIEKEEDTVTAWETLLEKYKKLEEKENIPSLFIGEWHDNMARILFQMRDCQSNLSWMKAQRASAIASISENKATLTKNQGNNFNKAWEKVSKDKQKTKEKWREVIKSYEMGLAESTISQTRKESWHRNLNRAKYLYLYYEMQPLWLAAEKEESEGELIESKLMNAPTGAANIAALWLQFNEVIGKVEVAWGKVIQKYGDLVNDVPETEKSSWLIKQRNAQYHKERCTTAGLWIEGQKRLRILDEAITKTESSDLDDAAASQRCIQNVLKAGEEVGQKWKELAELVKNRTDNIAEQDLKQEWNDYLLNIENIKFFCKRKVEILKASHQEKISSHFLKKAKALNSENYSEIDEVWKRAIKEARNTADLWNKVVLMCQSHKETINYTMKQDLATLLQDLQEKDLYYMIEPIKLETEQATAVTRLAKTKALKMDPKNKETFKMSWEEVIQAIKTAEEACGKLVSKYQEVIQNCSENKKQFWKNQLEEAKHKKIGYDIEPWKLEIERDEVIINAAEVNVLIENNRAIETESRQNLLKAIQLAERNCRALVRKYEDTINALPYSEQQWFLSELRMAKFKMANFIIKPFQLDIQKSERASISKIFTALNTDYNQSGFEVAWIEAFRSIDTQIKTYDNLITQLNQHLKSIPSSASEQEANQDLNNTSQFKNLFSFLQDLTESAEKVSWGNSLELTQQARTTFLSAIPLYEAMRAGKTADGLKKKAASLYGKSFLLSSLEVWEKAILEAEKEAAAFIKFFDRLEGNQLSSQMSILNQIFKYDTFKYDALKSRVKPIFYRAHKQTLISFIKKKSAKEILPKEPYFFSIWSEALDSIQEVQKSWEDVLQKEGEFQREVPKEELGNWKNYFDDALYFKCYSIIDYLFMQGQMEVLLAKALRNRAMSLDPKNPLLVHQMWDQAIERAKSAVDKWKKVLQKKENLTPIIPSSYFQQWTKNFAEAFYFQFSDACECFWFDAQKKGDQMVDCLRNEALALGHGERKSLLNKVHSEAIRNSEEAYQACQKLVSEYQNIEKFLPQNFQKSWNSNLEVATHWADVEEANRGVVVSYAIAQSLEAADPSFDLWWNRVVNHASQAKEAQEKLYKLSKSPSDIAKTQYWKIFYSVYPLWAEAQKAAKVVNAIQKKIKLKKPLRNEDLQVLREAEDVVNKVQEKWTEVLKKYQVLKDQVPANRRISWEAYLDTAEYQQLHSQIDLLHMKANWLSKIAAYAKEQAKLTSVEVEHLFQECWDKAKSKALSAKEAWNQVKRLCDQYQSRVSKKQQAIWKIYKHDARYWEAYYDVQTLWLEANKQGRLLNDKLENTGRNDFSGNWQSVQETASVVMEVYDNIIQKIYSYIVEIPNNKRIWNNSLIMAEYGKVLYPLKESFYRAKLAKNQSELLAEEALKINFNEVMSFKQAWNGVGETDREVISLWNDVIEKVNTHRELVPQNKEPIWDNMLHEAQGCIAVYNNIDSWRNFQKNDILAANALKRVFQINLETSSDEAIEHTYSIAFTHISDVLSDLETFLNLRPTLQFESEARIKKMYWENVEEKCKKTFKEKVEQKSMDDFFSFRLPSFSQLW